MLVVFLWVDTSTSNDISYGVTSGSICVSVLHMIGRSKINEGLHETTRNGTSLDVSSSQKTTDTTNIYISQKPLKIGQ